MSVASLADAGDGVLPPDELGAVAQLHRLGRDHEHDIAGLEVADLRADREHDAALEASLGHVRRQDDATDRLFLHRRLDQDPIVERFDERMAGSVGFERVHEAAGLGFEPRLTGPEPAVLPLDDPAQMPSSIEDDLFGEVI